VPLSIGDASIQPAAIKSNLFLPFSLVSSFLQSNLHTAGRTMLGGGFSAGSSGGHLSARPQTARLYSARDSNYGGSSSQDYDIYSAFPNCTDVSFGKFLDYCKDLSAALPRDTEFVRLMSEGFGVTDTHIERASLVKPGSIEDLLRTGRGAHGLPDATAVGRRPVEGLLSGGKPAGAQGQDNSSNSRYGLMSASRLNASLGGRLNTANGSMVPVDQAVAAAAAAAPMMMGVTGTAFGATAASHHHSSGASASLGASHGAPFNAYPKPALHGTQQAADAAASPYASRRPVHGASRPYSAMPVLSSSSPRSDATLSLGGTAFGGHYHQPQQQQQQLPPAVVPAMPAAPAPAAAPSWNDVASPSASAQPSGRSARPMTAMPSLGGGRGHQTYASVAAGSSGPVSVAGEPEAPPAAAASVRWGGSQNIAGGAVTAGSSAPVARPPSAPAGRYAGAGGALEGLPLSAVNYTNSPSSGSFGGTGGGFGVTGGGFGAASGGGSPASSGVKQRPQTAGPRVMLAPQLARSLGRNAIRL
jgi:hypothetical protein